MKKIEMSDIFPSWDEIVSDITDSRFKETFKGHDNHDRMNVQSGARIAYDNIYHYVYNKIKGINHE